MELLIVIIIIIIVIAANSNKKSSNSIENTNTASTSYIPNASTSLPDYTPEYHCDVCNIDWLGQNSCPDCDRKKRESINTKTTPIKQLSKREIIGVDTTIVDECFVCSECGDKNDAGATHIGHWLLCPRCKHVKCEYCAPHDDLIYGDVVLLADERCEECGKRPLYWGTEEMLDLEYRLEYISEPEFED